MTTSQNSSNVPKPPGIAMNASASAAIVALRSCIELTTRRSGSARWASSRATSACGMTPMAWPPAASTASAITPISPTRAAAEHEADAAPRHFASEPLGRRGVFGPAPVLDPQNTQTRRSV